MKQPVVLYDGYDAIMKYLNAQGNTGVHKYQSAYMRLSDYYVQTSTTQYNPEVNRRFRARERREVKVKAISSKMFIYSMRLSMMMDDYYNGKPFKVKYSYGSRYKYILTDENEAVIDDYVKWLNVSPNSLAQFRTGAREFLHFLQELGVTDFGSITRLMIMSYLMDVSEAHKQSMNNVMVCLRSFLNYLNAQGYRCCGADEVSHFKTAPTRRKVYPAFETDDLERLLQSPDRNTMPGIRDYAILLLGSSTGIRAIDVANLKFEDIDRAEKAMVFVQHKTSVGNTVPVDDRVLGAIDDYIRVRPKCSEPYVFLTTVAPYRKLSDVSSVRNVLIKHMRLSGVEKNPWDGKGYHAFRRNMGTWLLEEDCPLETISQILGHRDYGVIKHYLPISLKSLEKCAMGFELMPLRSEVYL